MSQSAESAQAAPVRVPAWSLVFFLSGFAALLYQVIWQRSLFAIYGINVESVTVIVTAFMLGLGGGSLVGGAVSKDPRRPALLLFGLIEMGIGLFGLVSLGLFRWVGSFTLRMALPEVFCVTLLLLLFPTTLMGATLPLLVAHLVRLSGNVGRSVGMLYFINTLGSALAAFLAVFFCLGTLGQQGSIQLAAVLNIGVGLFVIAQHFKLNRRSVAR